MFAAELKAICQVAQHTLYSSMNRNMRPNKKSMYTQMQPTQKQK